MSKNTAPLPDWELVLSSAARLQRILPDAVLSGGTVSAIHAIVVPEFETLVKLSPHEDDSMSEVKKRKVHSAEFKAKVGM